MWVAKLAENAQSEYVAADDSSDDQRTPWRQVYFAVEFPTFTGFEPRRKARQLAMFFVAFVAVLVTATLLNTGDDESPPPPTYPPLTFVTLPPDDAQG